MSTLTHYHKTIRKINAAFASLFNNIVLIRYNTDGSENQRLIVPIEFLYNLCIVTNFKNIYV